MHISVWATHDRGDDFRAHWWRRRNVDMGKQRVTQRAFLTVVFGAQNGYTGNHDVLNLQCSSPNTPISRCAR
jgi:hypothetical protein